MKLKISDNDDPDANPSDVVVGTKFVVKKFLLESLMSPLLINAKGLLSSMYINFHPKNLSEI